MRFDFGKPTLPSNDKRWKVISAAMRRSGGGPSALIETLHTVQNSFGYLEGDALRFVATSLRVPYSKVYGVATFYHHFQLAPAGKNRCVVCTGTACHIKGSAPILSAIEEKFSVGPGQTDADRKLSVLTARCLGACGLAPVAVFNDRVAPKLDAEQALARIEGWMNDDP